MYQLKKIFIILLMMPLAGAYGQTFVSGVVQDEQGELLVGVSVKEVGTKNGTTTSVDGTFSITCSHNAQLEFAAFGKSSLTLQASETPMKVVLSSSFELLEETVVVGYTSKKKQDITGCVAVV